MRLRRATAALPMGRPLSVTVLSEREIICHEFGPKLANWSAEQHNFWMLLRSWGSDWMWDSMEDEEQDLTWVADAFSTGSAICVCDGSYDRKHAPATSGAGIILGVRFRRLPHVRRSPTAIATRVCPHHQR